MSTGSLSDEALRYFESNGIQSILDEALHNLVQEMPPDPLAFLQQAFRRATPVHVVITGPRCSGKSTLAAALAAHYGVAHVSAQSADAVVAAMPAEVLNELKSLQREGKGWVLDGFPQSRADAIQLQTSGISPQLVFELQVSLTVALERTAADAGGCATPPEAIAKSYELYNVRRTEVVASYQAYHRTVDASAAPEQVREEVRSAIDGLRLA